MTLHKLLTEHRTEILEKCREKMEDVLGPRTSPYQLEHGIPTLYEELVEVLRISLEDDSAMARQRFVATTITASASRHHAQESYRLGYTVSQLVNGYGSICQGITEYAHETGAKITATEFSQLNLCLDVAIAQAVSEFETLSLENACREESLRLGFLVHELRNSLSNAMMAHELVKGGGVGAAGATSLILTTSHQQMKHIIDRAIAEVRLRGEPAVELSRIQLFSLLSEVESSSMPEANAKKITLQVEVDPKLEVEADRHFLVSAVANLVQNAIKFTKENGVIQIRAFAQGTEAVIEIEDECGGLLDGKTEELFQPYVRGNQQQAGLGLGLSIARRAIELNGGKLTATNLPEKGCIFTVRIPAYRLNPEAALTK